MANISVPSGFGGLTRFREEYASKFNLTPASVVGFVILILIFRMGLGVFYHDSWDESAEDAGNDEAAWNFSRTN